MWGIWGMWRKIPLIRYFDSRQNEWSVLLSSGYVIIRERNPLCRFVRMPEYLWAVLETLVVKRIIQEPLPWIEARAVACELMELSRLPLLLGHQITDQGISFLAPWKIAVSSQFTASVQSGLPRVFSPQSSVYDSSLPVHHTKLCLALSQALQYRIYSAQQDCSRLYVPGIVRKYNSVALVRTRTIPTDRPPLAAEI
jgi:hypothetical protein